MVLCHLPWFICRLFSRISVEAFALNLWNHPGICLNTQPILFGSPKLLQKHFPKYLSIFTALGNDTFFLLAPTLGWLREAGFFLTNKSKLWCVLPLSSFPAPLAHPGFPCFCPASITQGWEQFLCTPQSSFTCKIPQVVPLRGSSFFFLCNSLGPKFSFGLSKTAFCL